MNWTRLKIITNGSRSNSEMWNFGVELDDARMGSTWVCSSAMVPKNTKKKFTFQNQVIMKR